MTPNEFINAYNYIFENSYTGTYEIDKILNKYDPDGNLDLDVIFSELSDEDKENVESILSPYVTVATTEPVKRKAYDIYFDAWIQDNPDRYAQGVLDFYEALKSEGLIDLNYFDDEE